MTHDGDLIIDGVKLNAVNTYTGKTIITENYVIDRVDVFGTSTTPIEIERAEVTVNVLPNGERGFTIRRGTLDVQTTEPINGNIILGGGFEATIRGNGTFNGPIDYITSPGGGTATLRSGVFNGPIRGTTDLSLGVSDGVVVLNGANEMNGRTRIRGGTVIVNHAEAINLPSTQIESGVLELNVLATHSPFITGPEFSGGPPTLRLNIEQQIEKTWTVFSGTIEPHAALSFERLRLLGGSVASAAGGSTEIAGELVAYGSGVLGGTVTGSGTIRTVARTNGGLSVIGDLTNFTGTLRAETGRLAIGGAGSSGTNLRLHPNAEIHVDPQGSVEFPADNIVVENDIFLHNSHGPDPFTGALTYRGNGRDHILAGRIDVGDQGSTIVGIFDITGEFTGTNLTHRRGGLDILSPQRNLRGYLRLIDGGISLNEAGEFHGLDEIVLENGGRISLQPNANSDRIDDSTLIRSRGGSVSLKSNRVQPTSELLGTLRLERGRTSILTSSDHGSLQATLTISNIQRELGALLDFDEAGNVTSTRVNNVETFESVAGQRMIGGWASAKQGFASIDDNGFIGTVQPTSTDLNTAGPNDHVRFAGDATLDADKTIASLQHDATGSPFTLDLNGHRLRIRSGGIFRSETIENGSLTAGDIGEDAELIVHQRTAISADIVDNSESGSVSFVIANSQDTTRLSGRNSYTGGTYVNGSGSQFTSDTLTIESYEAIPENDRVFVNGGRYELRLSEPGTASLAELHLSNNGSISGFTTSPIDAEMFFFEDGNLNAPITGDGSIFKDSDGTVSITNSESPNFTGQVVVRQGTLSLDPKDLPQATYQVNGGRLKLDGNQVHGEMHLAGGTLEGGAISGDLFVDSDSTIFGDGSGTGLLGRLIGDANLTIDGRLDDNYFSGFVGLFGDASNFHGNFNVRSGPLQIGAPAQMGSGEISVQEGGRLALGSRQESSPATQVDNTIHLYGGTLLSVLPGRYSRDEAQPSFATGDVFVHTEAFIGATKNGNVNGQLTPGLIFAGRLILEDRANVYGLSRPSALFHTGNNPLLEISGQLLVGENTSWNLATASLLISGSISPSAAQSSIDFQGVESSLVLRDTEILTMTDKNLAVTINGSPVELSIQGAEAVITGSGQFTANVELTDGATISPGNSSGELTIVGATTFGSGSIYEWQLASNSGVPGEAWDLLQVEGDLYFTATTESPWILQVSDLPGFLPGLSQPWLIASANSITGFDPAAVQVDMTEITDVWPSLASEDFIVFTQTGHLFLQVVPEPTSCVLIGIGIVMLTTRCRFHRS